MELQLGLAKVTAKTKQSASMRAKLRGFLEARTDSITDSINDEILEPAVRELKKKGKEGLVVIADNLDRIHNKPKPSGRNQPEYIFVDRGEQLKRLNCHLLYTLPLTLLFSNDASELNGRFGVKPKNLSMVPVQSRHGEPCEPGLELLRQMVMARAFPELTPDERPDKIGEVFGNPEVLDRLCMISGGHVRNLISFLFSCLQKEDTPLPEDILDEVIQEYRDDLVKKITPDEWELLREVRQNRQVAGEDGCQILLRSMFVFEYQDKDGIWFDINPLLAGMDQLQS
ncbi:hypothetical protein QUF80_06650 [Desulfococcaceae bacterium HSG8]|nr:hypothetical protein [Desulfococcaceae bacterium HSG8]